jgi:hypothetical protein
MSKPTKVVIEFPTQEHAEHFVSWMCNSGEQDYWQALEHSESNLPSPMFDYEYKATNNVHNVKATIEDEE